MNVYSASSGPNSTKVTERVEERMSIHRKIIESPYGEAADNFHIARHNDEIHATLTYPPYTDEANKGQIRYIVVDQESVRASDGIRISYDYERDGYVIQQASRFGWPADDTTCDPDWQEVAFIQAWGREESEEEADQRCFGDQS
ncbi:hypothetical protein JRF84_25050 [Methylobacterium organophilum]|uniref:hypothetical protein n=1 Tax=Methylobacterium organophilum TaxID=410 RepID=UPI0019D1586A|nr:hypothetical protein [Methylobacterium organophilum]MBN6822836.1 hypothetical protein [Methylobacterium organophilum]